MLRYGPNLDSDRQTIGFGAIYCTVLAEGNKRSQRIIEAIQYGLRSSCLCVLSLKAPSDGLIPSVRTPCYFYIPGVLLCPCDTQYSRLAASLSLAPGHCLYHTAAHTGKQPLEGWWGFHRFLLSIVHSIFNSNAKRHFQEASQRGYNLSLNAQSHSRRTGNMSLQQFRMYLGRCPDRFG